MAHRVADRDCSVDYGISKIVGGRKEPLQTVL
jgi:hypothetical protein